MTSSDDRPKAPDDFAALASTATLRDLADIVTAVGLLDPYTVASRIGELRRGGLPSSSVPGGSRSAEKRLPQTDRTDRQLAQVESRFRKEITDALLSLRRTLAEQRGLLEPMTAEKANVELMYEHAGEYRFVCLGCDRPYKRTDAQRPRSGRCRYCYDIWTQAGRPSGYGESEGVWKTPGGLVDRMIVRESQQ